MDFDFQKGGERFGRRYPALRPTDEAIQNRSGGGRSTYYHYEPGNGTRYEVVFSVFDTEHERDQVLMSVFCPRNRAMVLPNNRFDLYDLTYMMEKLEMLEGDCYALIPLINHHLGAR